MGANYIAKCIHLSGLDTENCPENILDVAIIGAGICGTYTAYRLREKYEKIGLFESTDRIGGRLYTAKLPNGINVELGGMRFYDEHYHWNKTVMDMGLTPILFGGDHPSRHSLYYMRQTRRRFNESAKVSDFPGYNVRPDEVGKTESQLHW